MAAPRYPLVIDGELGPRYAFAIDAMTLGSHDGGWAPRGQGSHSRARAARRCSQPSRCPGPGDRGVTDRVNLGREFLNRQRLIPTCLEAS